MQTVILYKIFQLTEKRYNNLFTVDGKIEILYIIQHRKCTTKRRHILAKSSTGYKNALNKL